jgi:hypothetical protein
VRQRIDEEMRTNLHACASNEAPYAERRLQELDYEWDTDRTIETEASATGLLGLGLGVFVHRGFLAIPGIVAGAVLVHALTGWYPLLGLFRRLGVRSAGEIARERYALKALRGDFGVVNAGSETAVEYSTATGALSSERETTRSGVVDQNEQGQEGANWPRVASMLHIPPTTTRVEEHTGREVNSAIRARTDARLAELVHADSAHSAQRLFELDREWDIERVLQLNASILAGTGLLLGIAVHRRFLLLPAAIFTFFAQHALQGWCPPIPVFRRLGVRTAHEITRERYAVKALRGDFDSVPRAGTEETAARVTAVISAVDA